MFGNFGTYSETPLLQRNSYVCVCVCVCVCMCECVCVRACVRACMCGACVHAWVRERENTHLCIHTRVHIMYCILEEGLSGRWSHSFVCWLTCLLRVVCLCVMECVCSYAVSFLWSSMLMDDDKKEAKFNVLFLTMENTFHFLLCMTLFLYFSLSFESNSTVLKKYLGLNLKCMHFI